MITPFAIRDAHTNRGCQVMPWVHETEWILLQFGQSAPHVIPEGGPHLHWKGGTYVVLGYALRSSPIPRDRSSPEDVVIIYASHDTGTLWARNWVGHAGWTTPVQTESGEEIPRFRPIARGPETPAAPHCPECAVARVKAERLAKASPSDCDRELMCDFFDTVIDTMRRARGSGKSVPWDRTVRRETLQRVFDDAMRKAEIEALDAYRGLAKWVQP